MPEFLLELLSEEIPARMQARAADDLKRLFTAKLADAGLAFKKADAYVTPRRLTLVVDGLPERQPDLREEKKGPRVGAPEAAITGFLKSVGLASLEQCEKRVVGKAEFWFAAVERKGKPTPELLPAMVAEIVAGFAWPKSMRWASTAFRWVRPLRNVLCLWNGAPLDGAIALGEGDALMFSGTTAGHRFLAPEPFAVAGFADYKAKLKLRSVVLDQTERRDTIDIEIKRVAADLMLKLRDDPGLLDEVTGLVEWPVVLAGEIDPRFMNVPPEVLVTAMRAHQKYFALTKPDGTLAPRFLVVANIDGDDKLKATIVAGNERVLKARLSDAKFFWDQDRKIKLESRVDALKLRVFQARLGSMHDKMQRLLTLAGKIGSAVGGDWGPAVRAARLCKADLSSGMVGEFPELQGIMGRYYALHDGEPPEVAEAIRDHYAPLGPNDRCPAALASVVVALADKIDTLVGFFAINEKPTGSKDPFALRRAALGVIRIIIENRIRFPLRRLIILSRDAYESMRHPGHILASEKTGSNVQDLGELGPAKLSITATELTPLRSGTAIADELLEFFADRLKVALREQGVRHDLIDAVFVLGGEDDLVRLLARVDALKDFVASADGANLLVAYRRAANIVAIEEKKDGSRTAGAPDPAQFDSPEEKELAAALERVRPAVDAALEAENFTEAMRVLSTLRGPVDAFFDKVTVNAPEAKLRANRLRILASIGATLRAVADFSRIEG